MELHGCTYLGFGGVAVVIAVGDVAVVVVVVAVLILLGTHGCPLEYPYR